MGYCEHTVKIIFSYGPLFDDALCIIAELKLVYFLHRTNTGMLCQNGQRDLTESLKQTITMPQLSVGTYNSNFFIRAPLHRLSL